MKFRKCFKCNNNFPLFLFHKNTRKYDIPYYKGRCVECRWCASKRVLTGKIVQWDGKKFNLINIKPTLINFIKYYFK